MTNSGTEATMTAIRLARGFTRRDKIVKFEGCYHGHVDSLLVKAGSGALTLGQPDSAGIPAALAALTIALPFNDAEALRQAFERNKGEIAAVIVEPIPANAGLILPAPGFLETLRELRTANGALLIFDEVMTGFRVARGGAQELLGVRPDLSCFGKVIDGLAPGETPKTKHVVQALRAIRRPDLTEAEAAPVSGESKADALRRTLDGRTILLGLPDQNPVLYRSARNIEGVQIAPVAEFNTYDILKQRYLILTREALAVLKERVKQKPARKPESATAPAASED